MDNKYHMFFSKQELEQETIRLTNQLWKLIPMWEHGEDWEKQLNSVIVDVAGKDEIFLHDNNYLQLLSKLEGLRSVENLEFLIYRKTVFECIELAVNAIKQNQSIRFQS